MHNGMWGQVRRRPCGGCGGWGGWGLLPQHASHTPTTAARTLSRHKTPFHLSLQTAANGAQGTLHSSEGQGAGRQGAPCRLWRWRGDSPSQERGGRLQPRQLPGRPEPHAGYLRRRLGFLGWEEGAATSAGEPRGLPTYQNQPKPNHPIPCPLTKPPHTHFSCQPCVHRLRLQLPGSQLAVDSLRVARECATFEPLRVYEEVHVV